MIAGCVIVKAESLEDAAQWATRYIDAVEAAEVDLRELEAWGPETASSTGSTRKQP